MIGSAWRRTSARSSRTVTSVGRLYIQETRPSAKRFFERAASRARDPVDALGRAHGHRGHRDAEDLVVVERAVLERVGLVSGLAQVVVAEPVLVGDHDPAALELGQVRLQRRRVHRDEHVRLATRA